MFIVAGLGNPGRRYENTRHNLGFMAADRLAASAGASFRPSRIAAADTAEAALAGEKILLVKPRTYMNNSGEAVAALAAYFRLAPESVIVIHDDLDLDFGRVKIAVNRGAGGHNGIRSIIGHLGAAFVRVRLGIGRPPAVMDAADYVLGRIGGEEAAGLPAMLGVACEAVEAVIAEGATAAMNRFNRKNP